MKFYVCAVFDNKADCFSTPFFVPALGLAVRSFQDAVNSKDTAVSRHPDDFKLVHIANFDDGRGRFEVIEPVSLGFGTDFVQRSAVKVA